MTVYVIVNEYQPNGGTPCSEIVGGDVPTYWKTEQAAWDELSKMADSLNSNVGPDDTDFSVDLSEESHLEYDEYYIIELTEGKE